MSAVSTLNLATVPVLVDLLGEDAATHHVYDIAIADKQRIFLNHRQIVTLASSYARAGNASKFDEVLELLECCLSKSDVASFLESAMRGDYVEMIEHILDHGLVCMLSENEMDAVIKDAAVVACESRNAKAYQTLFKISWNSADIPKLFVRKLFQIEGVRAGLHETADPFWSIGMQYGVVWDFLIRSAKNGRVDIVEQFFVLLSGCPQISRMNKLMSIIIVAISHAPRFREMYLLAEKISSACSEEPSCLDDSLAICVYRTARSSSKSHILPILKGVPEIRRKVEEFRAEQDEIYCELMMSSRRFF